MRLSASPSSPGKVPLWRWWQHIFLQVNCTAQTVTIQQHLGGTRACSGHSFFASRRLPYVLRVHLRQNRSLVCLCVIKSSILWQSPGLPILLPAAISPIKSSCRITNKRVASCVGIRDPGHELYCLLVAG